MKYSLDVRNKFKSFLNLCACKGCYKIATKNIPIFCVLIPMCSKHFDEHYISDEDLFGDDEIEKILQITKIADTVLEVLTESDFEYIFELYDQCKIKTIQNEYITGYLSFIGEDCLKIQTEVGEKTIIYYSIEEIEKEYIL